MSNNIKINALKSDVQKVMGQIITTIYGPSLVLGIKENNDRTFVHLQEFGTEEECRTEDYIVDIAKWKALIHE